MDLRLATRANTTFRIAVLLGIGSYLWLSGCTSFAPEQPRTLMREVAQACASQVPDVAVLDVTTFGRLIYGYSKRGQGYRDAFLACYQAGVNQETHALVAPGHLPSAAGVGARTTVPLTRRGDIILVPVTLNRTAQVSLVVDTGASHTMLSPAVLARMGLAVPSDARRWTVTLPGRPPLSIPLVRVASLAIGALAVEDLDVGLAEAVSGVPGAEGVLGADVLGYCRLTVDRAFQQLTLEVIHATAPPQAYPVEGIVDVGSGE